ncbi:MAG: hypothetical protein EOP49_43300, partial [Sphingobacteriales bacterium]
MNKNTFLQYRLQPGLAWECGHRIPNYSFSHAQEGSGTLTVDKIMRDPKWIGSSPSNPYWSADGKYLFFNWNPDKVNDDSLYYITATDQVPKKAGYDLRQNTLSSQSIRYNNRHTAYVYAKNGDIFFTDVKSAKTKTITQTIEFESGPSFINNDTRIVYTRNQNLYAFDLADGTTMQLTNIVRSGAQAAAPPPGGFGGGQRGGGNPVRGAGTRDAVSGDPLERALKNEQLQLFDVLKERKAERDKSEAWTRSQPKTKTLRTITLDDRNLTGLTISPDARYVTYRLYRSPSGEKNTIIPSFVTESGFTTDIPGRTKVGTPQGSYEFFVYDTQADTVMAVKTTDIPGINDAPDYVKDYPSKDSSRRKAPRGVIMNGPYWSDNGNYAVMDIRSQDNKDRWLMLLDGAT